MRPKGVHLILFADFVDRHVFDSFRLPETSVIDEAVDVSLFFDDPLNDSVNVVGRGDVKFRRYGIGRVKVSYLGRIAGRCIY